MTPINRHYSLRTRIGKIVLIFSILLVSFYTTMLAMLYDWGLQDATHGIVWQEAHLYKLAYAKDKNAPLPSTRSLRGFIGEHTLPPDILSRYPNRDWQDWPASKEGLIYRFKKNPGTESHYHLLIASLPDREERLFVFYNITVSDEIAQKVWYKFKLLAIVGGILVIVMLLVFKTTITRSLTPMTSLSRWIDSLDQSSPPKDLPDDIEADEIGQMAASLYGALERIHNYNERERQFLRNASHELRTPIAIIRNAMDVLEYKRKIGDHDIDRVLQRIRRAGDTMKSVTEAILWLAIENYSAPTTQKTDLAELINEIIHENKSLNDGKTIELIIRLETLETQDIETALVHIVLDNLIRNAFQHSCSGTITIEATAANQLSITNSNHCYSYDSSRQQDAAEALITGSFGLGLTLVKKITDKQGWQFNFQVDDNAAIARIAF
ncbi:sensor histidine kinase [Teredinibacter purpureus]|uniref:sensor histidine kinase n=1 Tax=Teredinibacter purpureus TaxID=2731756 RepID=UPI0005F81792|nr:HAMP domain-containing sensor histidine kinase [Teredinibacter purpureus]